ncbi:MAG: RHS repeat-associated core domain-containing protein [Gemmatimonadetes bacterium]|nr:RHS repeat-associated core domain-containing protein [Gemmatimonadota bacterium]MBK7716282.1 RHS repeat-associated core domain-containing protein [Gemmatimonadota bacterium]
MRGLVRRDGTWIMSQRFTPYGQLLARDSVGGHQWPKGLHVGWMGRETDPETGLTFHRARYYSPELRRWTQEDPIGYGGGVNLYAYVGGAVLEGRDPSGLIRDCSGGACGNPHDWSGVPGFDSYGGNLGGSGGTWGERASRALQLWGATQTILRDMWNDYRSRYEKLKASYGQSANRGIARIFAGSDALSYRDFARTLAAARSVLGSQPSDALNWVTEHLMSGGVFSNPGYVAANGSGSGTLAITIQTYEDNGTSFTAVHTGRLRLQSVSYAELANVLLHETLHAHGFGECAAYTWADMATGYNQSYRGQACQ